MPPITTIEQLNTLDQESIVPGYLAGFKNNPDYTRKEQGYWHGFLNGQVDGGFIPISDEQRILARALVANATTIKELK